MRKHRNRVSWAALVVGCLAGAGAQRVMACSVCFGDPESPMAKGAVWGVLVLGGVVACVLAGIAGTGLYWIHRSRKLACGDAEGQDCLGEERD